MHRDLKPGNLRVTPTERLKILDFGLARLIKTEAEKDLTASLARLEDTMGTLPYMAPEQLRGETTDARSDIWSAGAVLYEMATGRRPFPESHGPLLINSILNHEPEPPRKLNREISPGLENVILKALDKDPQHRYQSVRELGIDLERLTTRHFAACLSAVARLLEKRQGSMVGSGRRGGDFDCGWPANDPTREAWIGGCTLSGRGAAYRRASVRQHRE